MGTFTRVTIVAYLAVYMISGGLLAAQLCARGVPLTLEHQAHHSLAQELGPEEHLIHHTQSTSYSALLLTGEPIVQAYDATSGVPLSVPFYANGTIPTILSQLVIVADLTLVDKYFPKMPTRIPLDPPPRF